MLDSGEVASRSELTKLIGMDKSYLSKVLRFTLLVPDIVEAILEGKEPDSLSLIALKGAIPVLWEEQREKFRFAPAG